eukprot:INCI2542.1.p1 GENE.INCI2542.1~~INCI2542.1.p1  ORF type:complete len:878 (-),score=97.88 INCI2542.1:234-2867(-)
MSSDVPQQLTELLIPCSDADAPPASADGGAGGGAATAAAALPAAAPPPPPAAAVASAASSDALSRSSYSTAENERHDASEMRSFTCLVIGCLFVPLVEFVCKACIFSIGTGCSIVNSSWILFEFAFQNETAAAHTAVLACPGGDGQLADIHILWWYLSQVLAVLFATLTCAAPFACCKKAEERPVVARDYFWVACRTLTVTAASPPAGYVVLRLWRLSADSERQATAHVLMVGSLMYAFVYSVVCGLFVAVFGDYSLPAQLIAAVWGIQMLCSLALVLLACGRSRRLRTDRPARDSAPPDAPKFIPPGRRWCCSGLFRHELQAFLVLGLGMCFNGVWMLAYLDLGRHPFRGGVKGCLNTTAWGLNLLSTFCGILGCVLAYYFFHRSSFALIVELVAMGAIAGGFVVIVIVLPIVNGCAKNWRAIKQAIETKHSSASLLWWEKNFDSKPARVLGKGAQGIVFEGKLLSSPGAAPGSGRVVAIKNIPTHCVNIQALALLQGVSHLNIVRYFHFETHDLVTLIALERCDETLAQRLTRSPPPLPEARRSICVDLFKGLGAVHAHGIAHRDIRPSNILLKSGVPKIADFGLAAQVPTDGPTTMPSGFGAALFQAPEVLSPERFPKLYPLAADCFSMGIVLHIVSTGVHPFGSYSGSTSTDLSALLGRADESYLIPGRIVRGMKQVIIPASEHNLKHFVESLLETDPGRRPANAMDCFVKFLPFFEPQPAFQSCSFYTSFLRDYLGAAFAQDCDVVERQKRRELAQTLNDDVLAHVKRHNCGSSDWRAMIEPRAWTNPPSKIYHFWNGKQLAGFGLVVWVRNLFDHTGQLVSKGTFESGCDLEPFVAQQFPWMFQVVRDFSNRYIPEKIAPRPASADSVIAV